MQTFLGIPDGVYVDSVTGIAGTSYPIGTHAMPVSNLTDAITIADARNTNVFHIMQGAHTLPADLAKVCSFYGHGENTGINLNSKNTNYARFHNLDVNGISTGSFTCYDCQITTMTGTGPNLYGCTYYGTVTSDGEYIFRADFAEATLDLTGAPYVIVNHASGILELKNMTAGDIWIQGEGLKLTIAATCTGGTINIYGAVRITDNSAGSTVNVYTTEESADLLPDGIYVNSNTGSAGTAWPLGTAQKPVNNLTDALTMMAARNLKNLFIRDDTGLALPVNCNSYEHFLGRSRDYDFLDLNSKQLQCFFKNLGVWGTFAAGSNLVFEDCYLDSLDGVGTIYARRCEIHQIGAITGGTFNIFESWTIRADASSYLDFTGNGNSPHTIELSGSITIQNVDQAGCVVNIIGRDLVVTLDATCTAGTINIYGSAQVINTSGGSTVNDYTFNTKWSGSDTGANYNIEIAHGVAEQDMFSIAKTGRYSPSIYIDLSTLVTAGEGGNVTLRLYNKVDEANYIEISKSIFTIGVTTTHPSFEVLKVNHNCKVTIQLSAAVTAQRTVNYRYILQDLE